MKVPIDMHSRFRELIAARLDGPLTRPELRALTSHLRTCATCREVDREYREQRNMLRSLSSPIPPRDLWARTSGALDREVARGSYRRPRYGRAFLERRRRNSPSAAVLTTIAALGLVAAIAVLQLAPVPRGVPVSAPSTPFSVRPQPLAFIGAGASDITVYRTQVSQVCPPSAGECAVDEPIERTAVLLPGKLRPRNVALSPSGARLALVGQQVGEDVIAVVTLPAGQFAGPGNIDPSPGGSPVVTNGSSEPTHPGPTPDRPGTDTPAPPATDSATLDPVAPTEPPGSAVAGMTVVAILDDVHSAGAPPAWSVDGEMLAFSAMPADRSHGPDVYVWSVGDERARPLTDDHSSYFASWSGGRIVASRFVVAGEQSAPQVRTVVIDPISQEERVVNLGQAWLPAVNPGRTHALLWSGELELSDGLPVPRTGALYLLDWTTVDPFAEGARPTPTAEPEPTLEPTLEPTPEPTSEPTPESTPDPSSQPTPDATDDPGAEPSGTPSPQPSDGPRATSTAASGGEITQRSDNRVAPATNGPSQPPDADATPTAAASPESTSAPSRAPATPAPATPDAAAPTSVPTPDEAAPQAGLVAVESDRDPRSDPVRDWQAHWSLDGQVVGIWIADAAGSTWGRLVVYALDTRSELGLHPDSLLSAALARRGFSLGLNRVAWVAPSDDDAEGELRIRTWGSDGVGGWSVPQIDGEEVVPAF